MEEEERGMGGQRFGKRNKTPSRFELVFEVVEVVCCTAWVRLPDKAIPATGLPDQVNLPLSCLQIPLREPVVQN